MIEGLRGQPKQMANEALLVHDFQPPLRAVPKPHDCVSDKIGADPRSLLPHRIVIRRINGQIG